MVGIETKNNPGVKISTITGSMFNLKESVFGVSSVTNTPHKLCVDSWWVLSCTGKLHKHFA